MGIMKIKDVTTGRFIESHGLSRHPLYKTFITMHSRCYKNTNPKFYRYGARNIKVCDRWFDINNFIEDMGEKPSSRHTLDRIDNDGNYEPSNCKWSTPTEQVNNRGILKNNSSGYSGISYNKKRKKWIARKCVNYKSYFIGAYDKLDSAVEALKEYDLCNLQLK